MSVRTFADGVLVEKWDDDARVYWNADEGVREYTEDEAAPMVEADRATARESRRLSLLTRIDAAITADNTYLASPVPATAAERLVRLEAQVERLTRQNVALLRLVGERLDDVEGV